MVYKLKNWQFARDKSDIMVNASKDKDEIILARNKINEYKEEEL